jgi:hypothetical protein
MESHIRFPSPPPLHVMEPSAEGFDFVLQRRREDIGDYNGDYIDSEEKDLFASPSSCE